PGELLAEDFDRNRVCRRLVEVHSGPDLRGHQDEADKEDGGGAGAEGFELIIAVGMTSRTAIGAQAEDYRRESEWSQDKSDAASCQAPPALVVAGDAVLIDRQRKPPGLRDEEIYDDYRRNPHDGSEKHPSPPLRRCIFPLLNREWNHKYH